MVPVMLSFSVDSARMEDLAFLVFLANLILSFNKGFYYHGRTITDRPSILKNFFKT